MKNKLLTVLALALSCWAGVFIISYLAWTLRGHG